MRGSVAELSAWRRRRATWVESAWLAPDSHIAPGPLAAFVFSVWQHTLAPHRHVAVAPLWSDRLAGSPVHPRRVALLAPRCQSTNPLVQRTFHRFSDFTVRRRLPVFIVGAAAGPGRRGGGGGRQVAGRRTSRPPWTSGQQREGDCSDDHQSWDTVCGLPSHRYSPIDLVISIRTTCTSNTSVSYQSTGKNPYSSRMVKK